MAVRVNKETIKDRLKVLDNMGSRNSYSSSQRVAHGIPLALQRAVSKRLTLIKQMPIFSLGNILQLCEKIKLIDGRNIVTQEATVLLKL